MLDDGVAKFSGHPSVLLQLAFVQIIGLTGFPVAQRTSVVRAQPPSPDVPTPPDLGGSAALLRRAAAHACFVLSLRLSSQWVLARFGPRRIRRPAEFALENPHRCSYTLFSRGETAILAASVVGLNLFAYIFFLASSLHPYCDRVDAETCAGFSEPSRPQVAVMGFFQVVNTRATGLQARGALDHARRLSVFKLVLAQLLRHDCSVTSGV